MEELKQIVEQRIVSRGMKVEDEIADMAKWIKSRLPENAVTFVEDHYKNPPRPNRNAGSYYTANIDGLEIGINQWSSGELGTSVQAVVCYK